MGVPIIRTVVFCGLYWGPPVLGNYHLDLKSRQNNGKENGNYYIILGLRGLGPPKVGKIMALMAIIMVLGLFFYILLGCRYGGFNG